jgi:hypothetical protein
MIDSNGAIAAGIAAGNGCGVVVPHDPPAHRHGHVRTRRTLNFTAAALHRMVAAMTERWRASAPGQYIDLEWQNGVIYLEDGPDEWPARGHQGGGGSFTLHEIRDGGREWFRGYDGLYERLIDDLTPRYRVVDALHGVVVTLDDDLVPCPTPCRFFVNGRRIYVYPADATPSRQLTGTASLHVAEPGGGVDFMPSWWDRLQGPVEVVDDPEWETQRAADLFADKYGDAAAPHPDDIPTLRIDLTHWSSQTG